MRNPAKQGDLAALKVGDRWILATVRQVDELGLMTVATDERGLYFRIEGSVKRYVVAAERLGGQKKVQELVEEHNGSFADEKELNAAARDWYTAAEIGEETLEDLT